MATLRSRLRANPADFVAAAAFLLSGVLLLHWMAPFTFWRDEWQPLLHRTSWSLDTFFDPFVEHLIALPILIYKVLVEIFGMESAAPFQVVGVLLFLLSVLMAYLYVRRRVGGWLALAGVLPVLFLGPSWDDLLFSFQMALFGSIACGIGALLVLERRDRLGDVVATALLVTSLLFSDLGVPFVAGATVLLAFGADRFRRAYIVVIPTVFWLAWYAGWGHTAETFISFHNFTHTPQYIADGLAASIATALGLGSVNFQAPVSPLEWGRPLLLVALAAVGWRLYVLRRVSPGLASAAVVLIGFWFLAGLNTNPFALAEVGRYQYIGIVLGLLVAAELLQGVRVGPIATGVVVFFGAIAALSNAPELHDAAKGIAGLAQQERGGLAALELTRDQVNPDLKLDIDNSDVDYLLELDAGSYLAAVDDHGSPAYTPTERENASEAARHAADKVFGAALDLHLQPAGPAANRSCSAQHSVESPATFAVPAAGLVLQARGSGVQASLRRYATVSFPLALGPLPAGQPELLEIPTDRSQKPWTLGLSGRGQVEICSSAD
jgi:hypothetical protein